jgi:Ca-activated chloride channel family protein
VGDPAVDPAPFGMGTVGARKPGDQGKPRFSLVVQRLDVKVTIDQDFAQTEVDQIFVNPSSDTVEGIFSFRTPPGAILQRFGVDRSGELVWGRIKESEAAERQYQSNVYQGSEEDPALLAWAGNGAYQARLYPIKPGATRRVVTRYTEWLTRQGTRGERRLYVYPMAAEGAKASLPRIEELTVSLDLSGAGARSVRAGMGTQRDGQRLVVKAFDFVPRSDLAVELFDAGGPETTVTAYRAPHTLRTEDVPEKAGPEYAQQVSREEPDYLAIPLRAPPDRGTAGEELDLAIVVDTSAATEPSALALARAVASSLLSHLGPEDRAALWAGDATLRPVAQGSGALRAVDPATRKAWLAGLAAVERGGATDIGALLTEAASQLDPKRQGSVVYIGDGVPSVGELVPKALRERLQRLPATTRILAAAVGSRPNLALLEALVRGAPVEQVHDAFGAARSVLRLLERAARPLWLGAAVDFGPGVERLLPRALPPILHDEGVLVVGRVTGKVPNEFLLSGSGRTTQLRLAVRRVDDAGDLRRRWGEGRLTDLMTEGAGRSSLVDVARRFGLVSPFTSLYVPTEREAEKEDDDIEERVQARIRRVKRWKPWMRLDEDEERQAEKEVEVVQEYADNKEGGTGTRAKGEEGSMGNPRMAAKAAAAPPPPAQAALMNELAQTDLSTLGALAGAGPSSALDAAAASGGGLKGLSRGGGGGAIRPGSAGGGLGALGSGAGGASRVMGPKGSASVGGANVSGGNVSDASRVVAGMRAGFRACFNRGLQENPDAQGVIRLTIEVGREGQVEHVAAKHTGKLSETVISCVRARASAAQFDPPEGGNASIAVPITFVKEGDSPPPEPAKWAEAKPEKPAPKRGVEPAALRGTIGVINHERRPCGPAADLPFAERLGLWRERLASAGSAEASLGVYRAALANCEASDWRERAALLVFIVDRLPTVNDRVALWRALLAVSPAAADAVYRFVLLRVETAADLKALHEALGLERIDADLLAGLMKKAKSAAQRLELLRGAALRFADDTELALLVLDAYEDAGDDAGGRAWARMLRRRVDATAHVRTNVGEYYLRLAGRGSGPSAALDTQEARRTFGELVEFAPEDPLARRRLGDLLRAHGWYDEALRHYQTLAALTPDDPSVPLLLAGAAQGTGKIEEAVRWAEKAGASGSPDGSSQVSVAARALASSFLAWARLKSLAAGKTDEAARLRARAARLGAGSAQGDVRIVLTWSHPELRPALWTNALGSMMPAPDNLPLLGVAQAFVSAAPVPVVELRLDTEDAARAARLDAKVVLTAIIGEGTAGERIASRELGFRGADGAPRERLALRLENASFVEQAP